MVEKKTNGSGYMEMPGANAASEERKPRIAKSTVQTDNDRCRVTRWDLGPLEETGAHMHEYDYCVVPLSTGQLTMVADSGEETVADMQAGVSYFREAGVSHNVLNKSPVPFSFVEIELK